MSTGRGARTSGAGPRPPLALALAASMVAALLLLPLAYLVIRVADGGRALDVLWDSSTLRLVVDTVLLVVGVVVAAIVVAVPTAWLVTRTDLPGRRLWAVAAALPLVIPSYVAAFCLLGFFGERGLLQQALGVERLPDPTGYWGRRRGADAVDVPVRVPPHAGGAPRPGSGARGGGPRPRRLAARARSFA